MEESKKPNKIILASTSIRRKEILSLLKIPFETVAPIYEEKTNSLLSPEEEAVLFATEKAKSLAPSFNNCLIIGSDTLIAYEGMKIGKPRDFNEAKKTLSILQGKWHQVLTAIAIIDTSSLSIETNLEITKVKMRNYSNQEIEDYILKDEPYDKAGSYALQGLGRNLIETLEGDYLSAIGLSLRFIGSYLANQGVILSINPDRIYKDKNFMNWKEY